MPESECCVPSPSSSPSLAPIDSSPPSSPGLTAIYTPPASPGAQDPFAGSTKSNRRPRIYERNVPMKSTGSMRGVAPGPCMFDADEDTLTRPLDLDDTTPRRVVDPFSASAKRAWRPPTYEKTNRRAFSTDSATSVSTSHSSAYDTRHNYSPTPANRAIIVTLDDQGDYLVLSDDEWVQAKPKARPETKAELERRLWDEAITAAIDKLNGVIDLSGTSLNKGPISHIPPSVTDLEGFVVLPPRHVPTSTPSSPKDSHQALPAEVPSDALISTSRPFTRATTLPAAAFNETFFLKSKDGERLRGTPAARAASLQSVAQPSSTPVRRREIHMFLANNSISRLPVELFRVSSLTVLSLRSNALITVPPQITQLTSLQELNLAQNKLQWLPAEMLNMRLTKLAVAGNPWIPPPLSETNPTRPVPSPEVASISLQLQHESGRQRPVSSTTVHFTVPPLTELCFRVLLAPYPPPAAPTLKPHVEVTSSRASTRSPSPELSVQAPSYTPPTPRPLTVLEAAYALPLTDDLCIGPSVLGTLRACVPAAVAKPATAEHLAGPTKVRRDEGQRDVHSSHAEDVFGGTCPARAPLHGATSTPSADDQDPPAISVCPSPVHREQTRVPVFVQPAEERWTWEEVIAGVRVGAEGVGGVGVPVRWRGCGRGCLAFLDPEPLPPPTQETGADVGPPSVDGDGDVQMEGGGVDVVNMQEVRFEGGLADPEEFEDGF
ncbi:hypothetical protein BD414DRAFT_498146 [Trametes punicea]|nr:hypothetical protein BD414DRAFT_498146 [Trametes punicea]